MYIHLPTFIMNICALGGTFEYSNLFRYNAKCTVRLSCQWRNILYEIKVFKEQKSVNFPLTYNRMFVNDDLHTPFSRQKICLPLTKEVAALACSDSAFLMWERSSFLAFFRRQDITSFLLFLQSLTVCWNLLIIFVSGNYWFYCIHCAQCFYKANNNLILGMPNSRFWRRLLLL